jgi:hypothetical protein
MARIGPANSGISTGAKVAMASVFIAPPRRSDQKERPETKATETKKPKIQNRFQHAIAASPTATLRLSPYPARKPLPAECYIPVTVSVDGFQILSLRRFGSRRAVSQILSNSRRYSLAVAGSEKLAVAW